MTADPLPTNSDHRLADKRAAVAAQLAAASEAERAATTALNAKNAEYARQQNAAQTANRAAMEKHARDTAAIEDENARRSAANEAAKRDHALKMAEYARKVAERNAIFERQRLARVEGMEATARRGDAERAAEEAKAVVPWLEAVTLCELRDGDPQARLGGWYCIGPLQNTHAKLDTPQAALPLGQACGTSSGASDLGVAGKFRAFGCGYGLNPNPSASFSEDVARKLGVSFVPGRAVFRCARNHSGNCRTR